MSIVKEVNYLAEKITGENPKKSTISDTLDYIVEHMSEETNDENLISRNIHKIADNYSGGGSSQSNVIPITENMTFRKFVMPENMKVTLDKNILDYFSAEEKAEMEQQIEEDGGFIYNFYEYVEIPAGEDYEESEKKVFLEEVSLNKAEGLYNIGIQGTFEENEDERPEFFINCNSYDGINFELGSWYMFKGERTVTPKEIELPIDINFSQMVQGSEEAKGWNDVLSKFLFTVEE